VVREEDEQLVVGGEFQHLLALGGSLVALENGEEVLGSDVGLGVVDVNSGVDVHSGVRKGRLIEDFALVGVRGAGCDIIIGEGNDVVLVEAAFNQGLVGVEDVGLVAVVGVSVGAGHQQSPLRAGCQTQNQGKENSHLHRIDYTKRLIAAIQIEPTFRNYKECL
jgi:hypothetical protein